MPSNCLIQIDKPNLAHRRPVKTIHREQLWFKVFVFFSRIQFRFYYSLSGKLVNQVKGSLNFLPLNYGNRKLASFRSLLLSNYLETYGLFSPAET